MEIETVGKVVVSARIESLEDLFEADKERMSAEDVRSVEVDDALVDTGATMLSLPRSLVEKLGLQQLRTRTARTTAGPVDFPICGPVRLTIQGRDCVIEVTQLPDDCPVLIGQIPLEMLDFVIDPVGQRLMGNPEHGGQHMIEMY